MDMTVSPASVPLEIVDYSPALAPYFDAINRAWIEEMFTLEAADREVLEDPKTHILDDGGEILFARLDGVGIIGTGGLKKRSAGVFELTKMGVTAAARGKKAGEALLAALIAKAEELGATDLILLTNAKCEAAIHLYEKLGFVHSREVAEGFGKLYDRCNVAMRYGAADMTAAGKAQA